MSHAISLIFIPSGLALIFIPAGLASGCMRELEGHTRHAWRRVTAGREVPDHPCSRITNEPWEFMCRINILYCERDDSRFLASCRRDGAVDVGRNWCAGQLCIHVVVRSGYLFLSSFSSACPYRYCQQLRSKLMSVRLSGLTSHQ
jgi:hypothetical protein